MLRKMTTIGLALGLLLPGSAVLAETVREQKEKQVRTGTQEMVQTGAQAAGDQERIQEQTRTREEKQARDQTGGAKKEASSSKASRDRLRDLDKDQIRDRDRVHPGSGTQNRGGGR